MEANTYSSRNNAHRAGVAAGVASALIEITVHKNGDEVRFGSVGGRRATQCR